MGAKQDESLRALPDTALDVADWEWQDIEAHYLDLQGRELTADSVAEWLAVWSRLNELIEEALNRLAVAKTLDTTDESRERRYNEYLEQIYTPAQEQEQKLKEKLLDCGLEPDGFAVPLRNLKAQAALFRESNLPLLEKEKKLSNEYDKIRGAQTVEWEGNEITLDRLFAEQEDPDRDRRERAWRSGRARLLEDRGALNEQWVEFFDLRAKIAANAELPNFRSYRWRQLLRFDYTPEDCRRFHDAITAAAVPAASRVMERRKEAMGLNSIRPWDMYVDKYGRDPLRPFSEVEDLVSKSSAIFHQVDPVLGGYFDSMNSEGLLDLDNRKGKAPGGYMEIFPAVRRPFIFMNAVGLQGDVQTLLHEGGHAFHAFETSSIPYIQQLEMPMEFNEVASMAMELLASPYLSADSGGFYSEQEAARARIDHLELILLFWPFMAIGDGFQHWIYENPDLGRVPDNLDGKYAELWAQFMPFVDWTDLEDELQAGWQRVLHFFHVPFYYVEYGLAQLGAVQIWGNAMQDQAQAVKDYRSALALAGTVTLPELYSQAGARFAFDEETVQEAVSLIEGELETLRHAGDP